MKMKKILITAVTAVLLLASFVASTASAAPLGERVLRKGHSGEDVGELQRALVKAGYYKGDVDGQYGSKTQQAVIRLQQDKQLKADGFAGSQTIAAIAANVEVAIGAAPNRYSKVLDIVATAYAPGPHDNGKWGNLTHIGTTVRPGIIAVDPKVIPLGTRVYIEYADGHGVYATAEDTGGAIKGNRIDIAMWTVAEAYKFGMQKVKVYVLE